MLRSVKDQNEKMLNAIEMDFWRGAAGRSRTEMMTNARIREIMEVPYTLVNEIKTKQLIWYGHVQQMNEERLPKQVLEWRPAGRRRKGRPRKSWIEGIKGNGRARTDTTTIYTIL